MQIVRVLKAEDKSDILGGDKPEDDIKFFEVEKTDNMYDIE